MNFRRIEYYFILAFFLLDCFLVYVFVGKNSLWFEPNQQNDNNVDIVQEMEKNEIKLPIALSDESQEEAVVAGTMDQPAGENYPKENVASLSSDEKEGSLLVQLARPVSLPDLESADSTPQLPPESQAAVQKLLDDGTVKRGGDYRFLMYDKQKNQLYFGGLADNGLPITDKSACLIFHLNDQDQIISYEQTHVSNVKAQGDKRTLISQKEAVENLYLSNEIPGKSAVISAYLSYQNNLTVDDTIVYRPVWTIILKQNDGTYKMEFIDAISGNIIQNSKSAKESN